MTRLPLRPLFFYPAYFLLMCIFLYPSVAEVRSPALWIALGGLGLFALQVVWFFQVLAFLSALPLGGEISKRIAHRVVTAKRAFAVLVMCLALAAPYYLYLEAPLKGLPDTLIQSTAAMFGVVAAFLSLWNSAGAVCEAEERGKVPANRVIGTFLLLFYTVIGVAFIYPRLKELAAQPNRSSSDLRSAVEAARQRGFP